MHKILILISILTTAFSLSGQIGLGPNELMTSPSVQFTEEAIQRLKSSKTVFVYMPNDNVEELEKAIREVWDITAISFVPYSKFDSIDLNNTSIFSLSSIVQIYRSSSGTSTQAFAFLSLWMMAENKRGKPERETYCRVELHPSIKNLHYLSNSFGNQQQTNYLYTEGEFENWTVGFLKNYLSTVNNYLDKGYERWLFASQTENAGLEALATNTCMYRIIV